MTKNQLTPTKAPVGIAGGAEASNGINRLIRLFDLEARLNNAELMCFNFGG